MRAQDSGEGELEGTDEGGRHQPLAGLGVSVHHCALLLVCSQQTGYLSGHGLQVSSFQQGCGTRARAGGCSAAWELKAFLGSVRARSCLEGSPSLPSLGRGDQSLCQSQQVGFQVQETGGESPCPGLPLSSHIHTGFLPRVSPASNTISSCARSV